MISSRIIMFTHILLFFFTIISCTTLAIAPTNEAVVITHTHKNIIGLRIAYIGCAAERVASTIASDLAFSGHFAVDTIEYRCAPMKKQEITALAAQNIFFLLILESHHETLEYRFYDTTTGDMIPKANGRCTVHDTTVTFCAHHIADKLWHHLMGSASPFLTHIAYAKEVPYKKGITIKHLCIADYDGTHEKILVATPTISIAPRWGGTAEHPLIFYSEYTSTNVQLMVVDMRKKRKIVSRYDGTTTHFTSNHDGSCHAFAASRGSGTSQIYMRKKGGELMQVTNNDATNGCPVFNHDSSILYYYSDIYTDVPHLICYTLATKKHTTLPISGYCVSPAYNNQRKLLAYSKLIDGFMQICTYNPQTQQEHQITFDAGNHEDPTWSPDGNFLAYTHEINNTSRIRVHAHATGIEHYITPAGINCTYPAWSLS